MTQFKVHQKLPAGFSYANEIQRDEYDGTGSVTGASKYVWVATEDEGYYSLAVRLHPPHRWGDVHGALPRRDALRRGYHVADPDSTDGLDWYVKQYNAGYAAAGRPTTSKAWESGSSSDAYDDGYLDRAAGRAKWHLTYCTDHDNCGEG